MTTANINSAQRIVIMGGNGRVGRETARYLLKHTHHALVLASRQGAPADDTSSLPVSSRLSWIRLDAFDREALKAILCDAALVVSCVGPSGLIGDRIASVCREVATPLIDAGGYDPLLQALEAAEPSPVPLIISVGLLPGLSGLFPKYLIERSALGRSPLSLRTYCIGRDAWSYNSAWDIIHGLGDFGQRRGFPEIRNGNHQRLPLHRASHRTCFPKPAGRVTTLLMPAEELARLARQLNIPQARAYGSNIGPRAAMVCLLAKLFALYRRHETIACAAKWLVRAARQDMRHLPPVYGLKAEVRYEDGESANATLMISDTYRATGATIAIAARCLLEGPAIPPGVYLLHEAMDCQRFVALLQVEGLIVIDGLTQSVSPVRQESAT